MRIVEVLIAIVLVFATSLLVANTYSILPPPVSYQRLELAREGYNILSKLDQRESLAFLIYLGLSSPGRSNWSIMVQSLNVEFAQNIFFNVTIWNSNQQVVNNGTISNVKNFQAVYQNAQFAASIRYFIAGYSNVNTQMTQFNIQNYVLQLVIVKVVT